MREVDVCLITDTVARLCVEAACDLPEALCARIEQCAAEEQSPVGQGIFADMKANYTLAREKRLPICQDTGMAVVFLRLGQDVHLTGGDLTAAVNAGVAKGYTEGYLRKSVVSDPLRRVNTNDNTPAVLHVEIVPGDKIEITVAPKGFGSENMSAMRMFTPSASQADIEDFIASLRIKARRRLVKHQKIRVHGKHTGNRNTTFLASGEFKRRFFIHFLWKSDMIQRLFRPFSAFLR